MHLGSLIRKYRKEKKLTLKSVSERAGISEGFLSQVENNVSSPSVETLMNICSAIGINAGDLLNQISNQEKLVVVRKSDWEDVDLPHTGFVTRRFFPPENRTVIDSAVLVLEPGRSIPVRKNIRNGQEVLCVLKGTLELLSGDQVVEMLEGDSVHFWSNPERQRITNKGEKTAVALWVGTL
ncbi:MAG: helix-turn-helix transcriptional regulator [Deltaproteobacteria bacterium]|nr:helix-turn-helix transcriptional regulator [Deltaproteobacteria bacterium]MBW2017089.1 helix-turn-helix transcriptional regulator [Deltaproteobacteria bacterium]MBW2129922.1 helix-turn-helix transcriptional regulator [Deltaproteobacteria bacterium]MBW2304563.1 helix-turn-helix transcriptional regulator [Deltaproteobacteria bacterium]